MRIAEFDYPLPPASIAQEAIEPRDAARLMRLPRTEGTPTDHVFRDLPRLLRPGDLLVVNRSRVFPARLLGRRDGGGAAEGFLLREVSDERWEALVRPGRRLRPGAGPSGGVGAGGGEDHRLEPEPYLIPAETAEAIAAERTRGGRVIAVGTTVVRALEAAARNEGTVSAGAGETALVVRPGFRFRIVDALITNFHLPRSSLLLLVAAFAGRERVLDAYEEAVRRGYRFYSYGDAMLLE